ncbi:MULTISPECIES: IclR family transcriptional regulator [unclassified Dietzia]|uniref:IclR family transcriptional regulator n=1 Tax=unclassified Dietzia TaxID=2617939 RepID=UPI000D21C5D1|nr:MULTISPECIES: IclR family transcriptional regulator [unclassified Dietzia]AVZ38418.1 IclR family transcriptional regulator [Dietzia sp. JS16-p6b]
MSSLSTVRKLGPILDLFTVDSPEWGVSEVSEALDIPRSSTHALLSSLVDIGLLQCRVRGRYRIGWRVVELSEALRGRLDVRSIAAPVLDTLVARHGETSHLAVMERMQVLYVDKVLGTHNVTVQGARIGARLDLHCTGVGKLLLAHSGQADVEMFLRRQALPRRTPSTITDPGVLLAELGEIRRRGFATDRGEAVAAIHCTAAPIRDDMGVVIAAISSSAPRERYAARRVEITQAVVAAAAEITRTVSDSARAGRPTTSHQSTPDVREIRPAM